MKIFQHINDLKAELETQGITLDILMNPKAILQPDKAFILDLEGSLERVAFGETYHITGRHGILVTLSYSDNIYAEMDEYIDKVLKAMNNVYDIVSLENFAYKVFAPQKIVVLYLMFGVRWAQ